LIRSILRLGTYVRTFALSGGGLGRRQERLYMIRSALLHTAGLDIGSLSMVLELSLRPGSLGDVPHGPSAWIPPRHLDGYMALAWIFECSKHVCLHLSPPHLEENVSTMETSAETPLLESPSINNSASQDFSPA